MSSVKPLVKIRAETTVSKHDAVAQIGETRAGSLQTFLCLRTLYPALSEREEDGPECVKSHTRGEMTNGNLQHGQEDVGDLSRRVTGRDAESVRSLNQQATAGGFPGEL